MNNKFENPDKKSRKYEEIAFVNETNKKQKVEPHFFSLPKYIQASILGMSGYKSMHAVRLTCKTWNDISHKYEKIFYNGILQDLAKDRIATFELNEKKYVLIPKFMENKLNANEITYKEIILLKKEGMNNYATRFYSTDGFYEGELLNGKPHGHGLLYKKKVGLVYKGQFKEGKAFGLGIRYSENGDIYRGLYVDNNKHGQGKLFASNVNAYYIGHWENNQKQGFGSMFYIDDGIYIGNFGKDMAQGKSVFISFTKSFVFIGNWKDNQRCGYGQLTLNKKIHRGYWQNNKANGRGIVQLENGDVYNGNFINNEWQGDGIYQHSNGIRYEGQFFQGKREGKGKLIYPSGARYEGMFKDGEPHGAGTWYFKNKHQYVGHFKEGKKHGKGQLFDETGHLYFDGFFEQDKIRENSESFYINGTERMNIFEDLEKVNQINQVGYLENRNALVYPNQFNY